MRGIAAVFVFALVGCGHKDDYCDVHPPTVERGCENPADIQAEVRRKFGYFRLCYEHLLRTSPNANAHVTTKFVIAADGSVESAESHGDPATDAELVQCVQQHFPKLSFPPPRGGKVTVVYPIIFHPGD